MIYFQYGVLTFIAFANFIFLLIFHHKNVAHQNKCNLNQEQILEMTSKLEFLPKLNEIIL